MAASPVPRKWCCDQRARQQSRQWTKCLVYQRAASSSRRHPAFSRLRPQPHQSTRCSVLPAPLQWPGRVHRGMVQPVATAFPRKVSDRFVAPGWATRSAAALAQRRRHRSMQQARRRKNEDHANSWRVSSRLTRLLQLQTRRRSAAATIFCMLSPDVRCRKISGIMINLPFGRGNNLREVLMPICRESRKVMKCQECLRLRSG